MEVVLREDVEKLGLRGEVVSVARGYARNFLLPRGLAEVATPGLVGELQRRDTRRAQHEAKSTDEAQAIAGRLNALELRFDANAGPTGTLFGSVTATTIADRLWEQEKIRIDRRKLALEPIKRIGRYTVPVEVFADVHAELRVTVAPEGQELPAEDELEAQAAAEAEAAQAAAAAAQAEHAEAEAAIEAAVEETEAEGGAPSEAAVEDHEPPAPSEAAPEAGGPTAAGSGPAPAGDHAPAETTGDSA